jgi:hypothetical protein
MPRAKIVLAAALFVVTAGLVFFFLRTGARESLRTGAAPSSSAAAEAPAADRPLKTVTLFFPREADGLLVPEEREIPSDPAPAREAEKAHQGVRARFGDPPETGWRLFHHPTDAGDFSRELAGNHPWGPMSWYVFPSSTPWPSIFLDQKPSAHRRRSAKRCRLLSLDRLFSDYRPTAGAEWRVVILGFPNAGKSTLSTS